MTVANAPHSVADRPRPMGRLVPLSAGLAALALASLGIVPAFAQTWRRAPSVDRESVIYQGPLAVRVNVRGGATPLYQASNRPDRWYLEAREGANYEINVRNTSGDRVAFVIAVDGLNAINGLRTHMGADEPMYVLDPYASTTVKGWRKDLGNVSKFVFVDEERSYAARTDQANGDLGWIRVAAFREFRPVAYVDPGWNRLRAQSREDGGAAPDAGRNEAKDQAKAAPTRELDRSQRGAVGPENAPAPSAQPLAERESSPGTGWGGNQRDRVHVVDFTPERFACTQVILRYEYRDALVSLGVLPWRGWDRDRLWERENGQLGFAQPPTR